ncbi:hypothetical protein [Streptomyces canus]|uniref:hypothetical protein n=1 Tax=Streptomyces canus TaxID=58343 RepID=UPI00386F8473
MDRRAGEGLSHGVMAMSTIARGRVTRIDTRAAEALCGVIAVYTHETVPPSEVAHPPAIVQGLDPPPDTGDPPRGPTHRLRPPTPLAAGPDPLPAGPSTSTARLTSRSAPRTSAPARPRTRVTSTTRLPI